MTDVKAMRRARTAQTEFFRNIGLNILYCACGTLITRGAVLGSMAPFGASYAAAVPKERLLPSLIGAAFGYVLLNPSDSFRYIAVIIAIGCARWLLSDIGRISASKLFAPLCAFIPTAATGIALSFGGVGTCGVFYFVHDAPVVRQAEHFRLHLTGDRLCCDERLRFDFVARLAHDRKYLARQDNRGHRGDAMRAVRRSQRRYCQRRGDGSGVQPCGV